MVQELKSLVGLVSFGMIDMPRRRHVPQLTWDFTRKRYPNATIKKYNARFCVRGYQ